MRDGRDLCRLRVRMRGEDGLDVLASQIEEHAPQPRDRLQHSQDHLALLHPVHRHVDVVAGSRGVQPAGLVRAARVDNQPLDEEEQILAATVICGALDVVQRDAGQRVANGDGVGPGDDALLGQHHEMR